MPVAGALWIPGLDPQTGTLTLSLWAVGGIAALFIVICALAVARAGASGLAGFLAGAAIIPLIGVFAVASLDRSAPGDSASGGRPLDARIAELTGRAVAPGSSLACLDAIAGETVEAACERTVFGSPESVAAAVSYVSARLSLLSDAVNAATRPGGPDEATLARLRRPLEQDRFGIVAQVVATRDGCTPDSCATFALMRDADQLKTNLREHTYDNYVTRHAARWQGVNEPALAGTSGSAPAAPASASASSTVNFPSASSIPPVSIMNSEPATPPAGAAASPAAGAQAAKPAPTPRRPPSRPPNQNAGAPVPITPSPPAPTNGNPPPRPQQ